MLQEIQSTKQIFGPGTDLPQRNTLQGYLNSQKIKYDIFVIKMRDLLVAYCYN